MKNTIFLPSKRMLKRHQRLLPQWRRKLSGPWTPSSLQKLWRNQLSHEPPGAGLRSIPTPQVLASRREGCLHAGSTPSSSSLGTHFILPASPLDKVNPWWFYLKFRELYFTAITLPWGHRFYRLNLKILT